MWLQMIVDPPGENRGFHRCRPRRRQCFHPAVQIEAGGGNRSFAVNRATAILYAVADRPLMHIQSNVIHRFHRGASLVFLNQRPLSSAFFYTKRSSFHLCIQTNQELTAEKSAGERYSWADRSRKSGKRLSLRLLLTTNEKYEHPHLTAARARSFAPNRPIPISIIRCQISLRTVSRIVEVPTFGCGLRHWGRSLQHVRGCEPKNACSILNWNCRSTLHIVLHPQPAHISVGNQKLGNGETGVFRWTQEDVEMCFRTWLRPQRLRGKAWARINPS